MTTRIGWKMFKKIEQRPAVTLTTNTPIWLSFRPLQTEKKNNLSRYEASCVVNDIHYSVSGQTDLISFIFFSTRQATYLYDIVCSSTIKMFTISFILFARMETLADVGKYFFWEFLFLMDHRMQCRGGLAEACKYWYSGVQPGAVVCKSFRLSFPCHRVYNSSPLDCQKKFRLIADISSCFFNLSRETRHLNGNFPPCKPKPVFMSEEELFRRWMSTMKSVSICSLESPFD